jgi:hypothetical protein
MTLCSESSVKWQRHQDCFVSYHTKAAQQFMGTLGTLCRYVAILHEATIVYLFVDFHKNSIKKLRLLASHPEN